MRRHFPLYLLAACALLAVAGPALAIPSPLPQGAVPYPTAMPTALATLGPGGAPLAEWAGAVATAIGAGAWVLGHWRELGELLALLVAFVHAARSYQWARLVQLAGQLTFALATLTNFDNDAKRRVAETDLYQKAGPIARSLFSEEQFALAIETGWKLIAKPRLAVSGS